MNLLDKIYYESRISLNKFLERGFLKDAGAASTIFGLFNLTTANNNSISSDIYYWAGAISAAGATIYLIGSKLEKNALEQRRKEELYQIEEKFKNFRHSVKSMLENQTGYFASVVKRIEETEKNLYKKD